MDELNDIFEALAAAAAGAVPAGVTLEVTEAGVPAPAAAADQPVTLIAPAASPQTTTVSALRSILQTIATPQAGTGTSVLGTVVQAASGATSGASSSSGGIGSTLEHVGLDILKSGFGLAPIIGSIFGLFGGGDSDPLPALVKYRMPEAIDYQSALDDGRIENIDYGQSGAPRAFGGGTAAATPAITVNVQAMDARSFLDRSSDIAAAVKDAMLNLNSINDVVSEL